MKVKTIILIVFCMSLIYASVYAGVYVGRFLAVPPFMADSDPGEAIDPVVGKKVNILCAGVDSLDGNTDTLILVCIDPRNNKINLLSIPRDTRIKVGNSYQKINYCYPYAVATGKKRDELLIQKVKEVTGLPVNYYVVLNFEGFRDLIDKLDGVEFDVPRDMRDNLPEQKLVINLSKGRQKLTGAQAEGLVRYRKTYIQGDIERVNLQQQFVLELLNQKLKPEYLGRVDDIYRTLSKNLKSNITIDEIKNIIVYLKNIPPENIKSFMVPGYAPATAPGEASYYIPNPEEMNKLVQEEFGYDEGNEEVSEE